MKRRKKLEDAGWRVGDTREFLGLTDAEAAYIELKLVLSEELRTRRRQRRLNQTQVARILGSSQSRVAKMEAADSSVSIDLLIKSLLQLGADREALSRIVKRKPSDPVRAG